MESPHKLAHFEGTPAQKQKRWELCYQSFFKKSVFFIFFTALMWILPESCRLARCPYCGGPLHHSSYLRKPRGGPDSIPDEYLVRLSLCCGWKDCRCRTLPPSSLFMGRRVYWGSVILVIMTLRQNRPNGTSTGKLTRLFGVSRNTIKRWIVYYRDIFPSSAGWQRLRGRISSSVRDNELPNGLVKYFLDHSESAEKARLMFLGLNSVCSVRDILFLSPAPYSR